MRVVNVGMALLLLGEISSHRAVAQTAFIGSPQVANNRDGEVTPFLSTSDGFSSLRYQQVYSASDFRIPFDAPMLISELRFIPFPDPLINRFDVTLANVLIQFSTTGRSPDGLSMAFADNIGRDVTTVFSGPLHFFATIASERAIVQLQTPFYYDPAAGNLLMEVRNFQTLAPPGAGNNLVEIENTLGDTGSSLLGSSADATTAISASTSGLVTGFRVTLVPEPSVWAFLAIGLAALIGRRCGAY